MSKVGVLEQLSNVRIVPIVVVDDAAAAVPLADALAAGGLPAVEVTLRTSAGMATIAAMANRSDILVGAGTVINVRQVDEAVDLGAKFIVSPGFSRDIVNRARELGVVVLPGIATASELQTAVNEGLEAVKLFPAHVLGGVPLISALAGPFPYIRYMPSGGITLANASEYLGHPLVFCVGASWIAPRTLVDTRDFGGVEERARVSVATLRGVV